MEHRPRRRPPARPRAHLPRLGLVGARVGGGAPYNGIVLFSIAIALIILHLRRQALTLRVLGGMLPICGFCKRIRKGDAWEPREGFISNHSEAQFSHTFCSECGTKHYGDYLEP